MTTLETLYRFAPPLIALQFLAFAWGVNREIKASSTERQTVIPLPDVINIISLFTTVGCLVVLPMVTESYYWLSRIVLGSGYVLIAFYPFTIAAHYGLWTREVPSRKTRDGAKPTYANREELLTSILSVLIAGLTCIGTGLFMMKRVETPIFTRNPYLFRDMTWGMMYLLHGLAGVGFIALIMVHIYMGLRPEKLPITKSMLFGYMDRDFYLEEHDPERWPPDGQPKKPELVAHDGD